MPSPSDSRVGGLADAEHVKRLPSRVLRREAVATLVSVGSNATVVRSDGDE